MRQNGWHFADDILKWIFLNGNVWILLKISLKLVPKVRINNIPALDQIMAWRRPGDKPLSEAMLVSLLTHICITWPQLVNYFGTELHRSGQTFAQVIIACCLTAPSHCLNKCWHLISEVLWCSPASAQAATLHNEFENYTLKLLVLVNFQGS